MAKEEPLEFDGTVVEALPDARFRVALDVGHQIIAYTAGNLRPAWSLTPAWSTPWGAWGVPMTRPTLLSAIVEALRSAGATEEIIAVAVRAGGEFRTPHRAREAARKRRERAAKRPPDMAVSEPPRPPDTVQEEAVPPPDTGARVPSLKSKLLDAARWNVDPESDVGPIRALLDQGCDLEADILPILAREVPELPRPLKNWGAPWLVRDMLAAPGFRNWRR
jgi:hypothetical protein